ncbi:MAG: hypothetical protein LBF55_00890 [Prevotellaceae bacterium]|nr:hypothetical protein [Prevotellaceae bacterium]
MSFIYENYELQIMVTGLLQNYALLALGVNGYPASAGKSAADGLFFSTKWAAILPPVL